MPEANFFERAAGIPVLGIGVSTEYGATAASGSLDVMALRKSRPEFAAFLEVGVEVSVGLDADALRWAESRFPTTYHFLDVNLDEPEDFDGAWLNAVAAAAAQIQPAWMCGDAGLWHFGPRDRGHMLLLPPVLSVDAAEDMARGIRKLREATGYEVLPENPPGSFFLGDMHILEYFERVCVLADTGMLLDCAHLAMHQRAKGLGSLEGLDSFDWGRVIELHVAGGTHKDHQGFGWVDDDHTSQVFEDTWAIFRYAVERACNLKAVVFECERNPLEDVIASFEQISSMVQANPNFHRATA